MSFYKKGTPNYSTKDLDSILEVFKLVWGNKYKDLIHAIPAYPSNSEYYKRPCRLISKGKGYIDSPKWRGFYPRISSTVNKIRNIKEEQFMIGLFDINIAVIDIDNIYDYRSKEYIILDDTNTRNIVRETIIEAVKKYSDRFIIEDSNKGFHIIYYCRPNDYYTVRSKYIVLNEEYVCRYDIISCKNSKIDIDTGNSIIKDVYRPTGGYTLLGYGKNIKGYTIRYVGKGHSLSKIPNLFTNEDNYYQTLDKALESIEYQRSLSSIDYRSKVRQDIFYEWYLKSNLSRSSEIAIEKMIDKYVEATNKLNDDELDKGFIKDEKGNNIDFKKLTKEASPNKVDRVRNSTIESVYSFYSYLNNKPVGTEFDNQTLLKEFIDYCKLNDLELRGLWSNITGKLLFTNRMYKILNNLSKKNRDNKLHISSNNYRIIDNTTISTNVSNELSSNEVSTDESIISDYEITHVND